MTHPYPPNPISVASFPERLAKQQEDSKLGIAFTVIAAVSMAVITSKALLDMLREQDHGHARR